MGRAAGDERRVRRIEVRRVRRLHFLANSRQTEENGPALFAGIARDAGALRALWQTLPD